MVEIIAFTTADPHFLQFQSLFQQLYGTSRSDSIPILATCYLAVQDNEPLARLSAKIIEDIQNAPNPCGIIGHYEALNPQAGIALLKHVQQKLKHTSIIGPMNDSTWDRYRLALPPQPGDLTFNPSTFLGEPRNPPEYHSHFISAGFTIVEHYESRIFSNLTCRLSKYDLLKRKMERLGINVKPVDLNRYENELKEIFTLSTRAFAKNPFYRLIDFTHFKSLYEGIRPYLNPEFILIARDKENRIIGYTFNYPDLESVQAKKPPRLIVKTLAVDENMRGKGVAMYLLDEVTIRAHQHGYQSIIHALMHCDNDSLNISQKGYGTDLFKRYALYQWQQG